MKNIKIQNTKTKNPKITNLTMYRVAAKRNAKPGKWQPDVYVMAPTLLAALNKFQASYPKAVVDNIQMETIYDVLA